MNFFYFFLLFLWVSGCTTSKVEFSEINFKAEACFGTCPVFTMTIVRDGAAHYNAKMFNEREGEFNTVIKPPQLDSLNQLIRNSGLLSLKSEYSIGATDHPTYSLQVKLSNGQVKSISDYGPAGPDKLKRLYHLIFSLRQSQDWR